jgi:hypothetical protein
MQTTDTTHYHDADSAETGFCSGCGRTDLAVDPDPRVGDLVVVAYPEGDADTGVVVAVDGDTVVVDLGRPDGKQVASHRDSVGVLPDATPDLGLRDGWRGATETMADVIGDCYDGGADVGYQRFHAMDCDAANDADCRWRDARDDEADASRYDSIGGVYPPRPGSWATGPTVPADFADARRRRQQIAVAARGQDRDATRRCRQAETTRDCPRNHSWYGLEARHR